MSLTFNRTLLELKQGSTFLGVITIKVSQSYLIGIETIFPCKQRGIHNSLNRTLLELKQAAFIALLTKLKSLNRTLLELKLPTRKELLKMFALSIVPYWN